MHVESIKRAFANYFCANDRFSGSSPDRALFLLCLAGTTCTVYKKQNLWIVEYHNFKRSGTDIKCNRNSQENVFPVEMTR